MNSKHKQIVAIIITGLFTVVLAGTAQAQWTLVNSRTDNTGKLVSSTEKHRNGSIKMTNRQYHFGTRVIRVERVTTFGPRGDVMTIIQEDRDKLNRITFQSNEFKNNRGVWEKFKQWITYRDDRDRQGTNRAQRWDPKAGRWVRA